MALRNEKNYCKTAYHFEDIINMRATFDDD